MTAFFEHDDLRLAVADRGNGLPVLFQHGLCGDAAQPSEVFPFALPARCLTLECRGHGRSDAGNPENFSIATFADDVAAWLDSLSVGPLVIGGISMGAAISLRLAVIRPDLVKGLVLARPAWVAEAGPDNMKPNAVVGELLAHYPAEEARKRFDALPSTVDLEQIAPDNIVSLRSFFQRAPLSVTSSLLTRISVDGPGISRAQIEALDIPTLVIGSGIDAVHPFAHAEALAGLIPDARLVRITPKATSKAAYVADFNAALTRFLSEFTP